MVGRLMIALALVLLPALATGAGPDIRSEITGQLSDSVEYAASLVEVRDIELNRYVTGPDGYDSVSVMLPYGIKGSGRVTYAVNLIKDGREVERFWAAARVVLYREAVVALKPLRRGRVITEGDVKVELVEIKEAERGAGSIEEVIGMAAKRPINPGSVVKREYIRPVKLIARGDLVTVKIENERLKIKSKARALENGHRGSVISVRTASGKELKGRVTGPGELAINF